MSADPLRMHEDQRIDLGATLAEDISEERQQAAPHRWQSSRELRARIVAYAITCRTAGESHQRIAARLGVCQPTLSRWIRRAGEAASPLRSVAIVPTPRRRPASTPAPSVLRLITPHGFVVEGLDPEILAHLLHEVG